jgi:leucyl aminopeptidase
MWISIGADAFASLSRRNDLSFQQRPLQSISSKGDVVVSRVRQGDLETLSRLLHEQFQRCSGFVVHPSRETAEQAMDAAYSSQLLGATVPYIVDQPALVSTLQSQILALNLQSTIQSLSQDFNNRYYRHPSGAAASTWIRDLWQSYASQRPDVSVELYEHSGWIQPSVILTIPGTWRPDEVVVLGGHMDSIAGGSGNPDFSAPGADDNASGIAALSEVIRVALSNDFRPQRTVKFMAYAAEEVGLLGSGEIASQHVLDNVDVIAVMQLDMTGFNGSTEDILLLSDFTNPQLTAFIGELLDTYQPELVWSSTACGYGCSDHASWHNRGFAASLPFEARVGQHNGAIHSTQDTYATLGNTANHVQKFSRLAAAFAVELGLDELGELFRDGFETGTAAAWSATVTP